MTDEYTLPDDPEIRALYEEYAASTLVFNGLDETLRDAKLAFEQEMADIIKWRGEAKQRLEAAEEKLKAHYAGLPQSMYASGLQMRKLKRWSVVNKHQLLTFIVQQEPDLLSAPGQRTLDELVKKRGWVPGLALEEYPIIAISDDVIITAVEYAKWKEKQDGS